MSTTTYILTPHGVTILPEGVTLTSLTIEVIESNGGMAVGHNGWPVAPIDPPAATGPLRLPE
jgi:hypothetical protein